MKRPSALRRPAARKVAKKPAARSDGGKLESSLEGGASFMFQDASRAAEFAQNLNYK